MFLARRALELSLARASRAVRRFEVLDRYPYEGFTKTCIFFRTTADKLGDHMAWASYPIIQDCLLPFRRTIQPGFVPPSVLARAYIYSWVTGAKGPSSLLDGLEGSHGANKFTPALGQGWDSGGSYLNGFIFLYFTPGFAFILLYVSHGWQALRIAYLLHTLLQMYSS